MKGRWVTQPAEPWSEVGRSGELSDVLVLEATYLQSEKVRDLTLRYLGEGRGVLLFVERDTPLVEAVLRDLGLEPRPQRGAAGREVGFRYLAADHPIFQPFLSPDFGSLTGIRVRDYLPLKATGANGLLFAETGDAVVFEGTRTKGRLLVFGFGISRAQTNWAIDPTFIPFLDLCLQYVRDEAPREATLLPGEPHVLDLPKGAAVHEVVLMAASEVVGRAPVDGGRATLRLPRRPGLYVVTHDADPTPQAVLAVNPSPKESILRYVAEPPALQAWQAPPASPPHAGPSSRRAAASRQAAADQRLWWWALAAAGLLLAAETSWLTWRKERA
jgi:hypothetical protein